MFYWPVQYFFKKKEIHGIAFKSVILWPLPQAPPFHPVSPPARFPHMRLAGPGRHCSAGAQVEWPLQAGSVLGPRISGSEPVAPASPSQVPQPLGSVVCVICSLPYRRHYCTSAVRTVIFLTQQILTLPPLSLAVLLLLVC